MTAEQLNTPVLLVIFNRADTTQQVFNEIRKVKPKKLFVAADGPRDMVESDKIKCQETRKVIDQVDWDCQVYKRFLDKNLGCRDAASSAIDWFFENVEEGIILEDDTLPTQSFFWFCQDLLEYYRDDTRIMHIGGGNFQYGKRRREFSYYFSKIVHVWGWATWRRAWKYFDINIESFPDFYEHNEMRNVYENQDVCLKWYNFFNNMYLGANGWDFQWGYTVYSQNGLSVIPNVNLVSNIGFRSDATHSGKSEDNILANIPRFEIEVPLKHPNFVLPNLAADYYTFKLCHGMDDLPTAEDKYREALRYQQEGNYSAANDLYFEVLKEEPYNHDVLFNLGTLALKADDIELAFLLFEKAAKYNPSAKYYKAIAEIFFAIGNREKAIEYYKKVLEFDTADIAVYDILGTLLLMNDLPEESIDYYKKFLKENIDSPECNNNIGVAFYKLKNYDEAIKYYKKAVDLNGDFAEAQKNLQDAKREKQNLAFK